MNNFILQQWGYLVGLQSYIILTLSTLTIGISQIEATILSVPGQYPSIQEAVDVVASGDTILVAPGTYPGGTDILFKPSFTLASFLLTTGDSAYIDSTIITANSHGFNISNILDSTLMIAGFKIQESNRGIIIGDTSTIHLEHCHILSAYGGGIWVNGDSVIVTLQNSLIRNCGGPGGGGPGIYAAGSGVITIDACTIRDNVSYSDGLAGGLNTSGLSVDINNSRFTNNESHYLHIHILSHDLNDDPSGGAINAYISHLSLNNTTIDSNRSIPMEGYPSQYEVTGGGLRCRDSDVIINNCTIAHNAAGQAGGGIWQYRGSILLDSTSIIGNSASHGGGLAVSQSTIEVYSCTFESNTAGYSGGAMNISRPGPTLIGGSSENANSFTHNFAEHDGNALILQSWPEDQDIIDASYNGFTYYPVNELAVSPLEYFNLENGYYTVAPAITDDCYLSPSGSDENDGLTPETAIQTFQRASQSILSSLENQVTINLLAGTYSSTETGETFPIVLPDFVHISGAGQELSILDGENQHMVIRMDGGRDHEIRNLSIIRGGPGVHIAGCSPIFDHVSFMNCRANSGGACHVSGDEESISSPIFRNCEFLANYARHGGAIWLGIHTNPIIGGSEATGNYFDLNVAAYGCDIFTLSDVDPILNVGYNTFPLNPVSEYSIHPITSFDTSDCLGIYDPLDSPVYLRSDGSNLNDGNTTDTPLRDFSYALSRSSDMTPQEVLMLPGTYSASQGQIYPFVISRDSVSLLASSMNSVILTGGSVMVTNALACLIEGVKINWGSGMRIQNSEFLVKNCDLHHNTAGYALNLINSDGVVDYCSIQSTAGWEDNSHGMDECGGGGALYIDGGSPIISRTIFRDNNVCWPYNWYTIRVTGLSTPIFWGNHFHPELDDETITLYRQGPMIVATENWWGHATGPSHDSNPGGQGVIIQGNIEFDPWLAEPTLSTDGISPEVFHISAAYPNPFNASISMDIDLVRPARVEFQLFDLRGIQVYNIHFDLTAGSHQLQVLDHNNLILSGGLYFLRVSTGHNSTVRKITYLS